MVGGGGNLQALPSGIGKERIDEVADTETAHADNTSPPSKLLGVSLIAANKPGRRVALDPDRAYF